MLELRPTCEHCNKALPAASTEAMICSFECTFCRDCVELLGNVCPNCGGGFAPRPVRPPRDWKNGNDVAHHPPSTRVVHKPVNVHAHADWAAKVNDIAPAER